MLMKQREARIHADKTQSCGDGGELSGLGKERCEMPVRFGEGHWMATVAR